MRLLVLGGTKFLGRHVVDAALARGHDVTIFTRGRNPAPWGDTVRRLTGDRDPDIAPGLAALEAGSWDAVIDTSGYVPRCVGASARILAGRASRYLFVSSLSVYADSSRPGEDESAAVAKLEDPAVEDVMAHYGALKAACESEVRAAFGERAVVVRPGLIVGPHDPSDRFSYWVARFVQPELLGDRQDAVVPAPPSRPIQIIDARDLAEWMIGLVADGTSDTFNACSPPGRLTMGMLVDALLELGRARGAAVAPAWIDERKLLLHGVEPWTELPLWIPETDPSMAGFMSVASAKGIVHGLVFRPLERTLVDTADWLAERDSTGAWRNVLTAAKERALLQ
jgi:2'-hydroxyisoflavone reductase